MTPWHLHSEEEREQVIRSLANEIEFKRSWYPRESVASQEAFAAAIAFLRDAALWPDEALVVEVVTSFGVHGPSEIQGVYGDILDLCDIDPERPDVSSGWRKHARDCRPLTPAAAEFLAALGGGE